MSSPRRHIALVAHDNKKVELLEWAAFNAGTLTRHHLYATGTTGTMLEHELGSTSPASSADRSAAISRSARRSPKV